MQIMFTRNDKLLAEIEHITVFTARVPTPIRPKGSFFRGYDPTEGIASLCSLEAGALGDLKGAPFDLIIISSRGVVSLQNWEYIRGSSEHGRLQALCIICAGQCEQKQWDSFTKIWDGIAIPQNLCPKVWDPSKGKVHCLGLSSKYEEPILFSTHSAPQEFCEGEA